MARNAIVSDGVATGEQVKYDADEGLFVRDAGHDVFVSGRYYVAPVSSKQTVTPGEGQIHTVAFPVSEKTAFDRIGANVTGAGEAGAVIRLGLYGPSTLADGAELVVDAGTVAADSTGVKELTIDVDLEPGVYWPVAVPQLCPTTQPTVRAAGDGPTAVASGTTSLALALNNANYVGLLSTGNTGALPATLSGTSPLGIAQIVALRAV